MNKLTITSIIVGVAFTICVLFPKPPKTPSKQDDALKAAILEATLVSAEHGWLRAQLGHPWIEVSNYIYSVYSK